MKLLPWTTALLLCAATAFAQSDRGTITGTVTDTNGGVLPGVTIVAENPETGTRYEAVTTPTGNYTLSQLPVGVYALEASLEGFGPFRQEGIRLFVGQTARIDPVLQVGGVTEEVRVAAGASLLKTESAEQSSSITSENLNELPLNFGARGNFAAAAVRNPYSFAALVPGGKISSYSSIKIGGAPLNTFQIRVEGMEANNQRLLIRIDQVQPSVESLEEMTVHTSNFAPEYGQVAGGVFNLTAKSGTNTFSGGLFEYFVHEALGASIPFTDEGVDGKIKPRNRRHNFGGSLGGPVVLPGVYDGHDRTFFFFSYEHFRQAETRAGLLATMPSDAMRRGDFSAALTGRVLGTDPLGRPIMENAVYDPSTTRLVNGQVVRDPFRNNVIPQDRLDPVALGIQSFVPHATRPGIVNNWDQSFPADSSTIIGTIKVDHNLPSLGGRLSGYYSRYYGPHFNGSDGLPLPITAVRDIPTSTHTARVSYDWTITPTTLLDARAGYINHHNPDLGMPEVLSFDPVTELGLTGAVYGKGFPVIGSMFSPTGGGMSESMARAGAVVDTRKPQFLVSVTHARNDHTYKAGVEWRDDIFENISIEGSHGEYGFSAEQTGLPSTQGQNLLGGSVGLPYASFLLGLVDAAEVSNSPSPIWRKPALSAYVQDTWRIASALTLDYGVRWDYQGWPYEQHDRRSMFSPETPNPSAGGLPGATIYEGSGTGTCNCRFVDTYPYSFGPRVGLAFQLNPETVIRGGWGITYGQTADGQSAGGATLGAGGWRDITFESPAFGQPGAILREGVRYNRDDLFRVEHDPGIRPLPGQIGSPPDMIHPDAGKPPRLNQWSIGVQREITNDLMVEVAYVGNRGTGFQANHLMNLNAISEERLRGFGLDIDNAADRELLRSRLDSGLARSRGFGAPYDGFPLANTVAQSLRPFPQFDDIDVLGAPLGKTRYDALQVKATKRYGAGLNLTGTFTWQNERTNMGPVNNVFDNPGDQWAVSEQSEPLVAVVAFSYELPAMGSNWLMRNVVAGLTFGGILRYASGLPIEVPQAQSEMDALLFQDTRMNRLPGEPLYLRDLNGDADPNQDFVLNPNAWSNPAEGEWGTAPAFYDDYRYQRRPDEQLSIGKMLRFGNGRTLQIRAEFFNVFNRTSLNDPNAANPLETQRVDAAGVPIAGFGRIDTGSTFGPPRSGQIVARIGF